MCVIIDFQDYVNRHRQLEKASGSENMSRTEALVKGLIEKYTCDLCGGSFEVINDQYPENCPCCDREIVEWN